jgi:TetR/AcrR family transcriptional repressor of nem operon
MKVSKAESARHHEALLQAATRLFRERGFEKVSVADVAAAADLTHGAFYTHFESKEALCAEALETAIRQNWRRMAQTPDRATRIANYLSERHVQNRAEGCPIAALSGEVGRGSAKVRAAFTRGLANSIQSAADARPELGDGARGAYIASLATMAGALVLARAVSDPKLRDEILAAAKAALLGGEPRNEDDSVRSGD